jgi:hypothetical protein
MTLKLEPRDGPPDPRIATALKAIWPIREQDRFLAVVLARSAGLRPRTTLERWARPALAAAASVALAAWVAGGLLDAPAADALTLDGALVSSATGSTPAALVIAAPRPPDAETIYAGLVSQ